MKFEWDPGKAAQNLRKHGVEFVDVVIVFDDDRAITLPDEHPTEDRYLKFRNGRARTGFGDLLRGGGEQHSHHLGAEGDLARAGSI